MLINGISYIGASELATELGVSRQTLWRWRTEEKIPQGHRFRDKRILFTMAEVDEIRQYANKLEPATPAAPGQFKLFNGSQRSES
jgi:predicted DNA-binding transcriptional regulator AlpA